MRRSSGTFAALSVPIALVATLAVVLAWEKNLSAPKLLK